MEEYWKSVIDLLSSNSIKDGDRLRLSWSLNCEWETSVSQKKLTSDMQDIYNQLKSLSYENKNAELVFNDFMNLCNTASISL